MKSQYLHVCALALASIAMISQAHADTPQPKVDVKKLKSLEDNKEVFIGDFRVTFIMKDSVSATAKDPNFMRGGDATDYAKSNLEASLTGVPEPVMQSITDDAYTHFMARLKAQGYAVLDNAQLNEIKDWGKLKRTDSPSKAAGNNAPGLGGLLKKSAKESDQLTFSPSGMPLIEKSAGNVMPYKYGAVAEKIGKPIIRADYRVHFAYFGKDTDYQIDYAAVDITGSAKETLTASTSVGQGIQVIPGSEIHVTVDGGGTFTKSGYATLRDPLVVSGDYGKNLDTTSGANKAANAFSSAVGLLSGGSSKTVEISIEAVPEFYAAGATKALELANEALISTLPQ